MMCYWWLFWDHRNCSMIASFSVLFVRTVQWEVFWEEKLSWVIFSEVCVDCETCLGCYFLKIHILWFCTSFALHRVKETFGGSRWKFRRHTCVSRFLAYVRETWIFCLEYRRTCLASFLKQGNAGFKLASTWSIKKHAACSLPQEQDDEDQKRCLIIHQDSWTNQSCCYVYSSEKLHVDSRIVKTFHRNGKREGLEYWSRSYHE